MDFGPEESQKTMVEGTYQGRLVSSTSTVTSELSTDGGSSYLATLTKEFTSFNQVFQVLSSGVTFDTIKHRLGLKHTAAAAGTPNGTGVMWTSVQQWDSRYGYRIAVELDISSIDPDLYSKMDEFDTLQLVKNVQALTIGSKQWNAVYEGMYIDNMKVPPRGQAPTSEQLRDYDKKGGLVEKPVQAWFRVVPGTVATS